MARFDRNPWHDPTKIAKLSGFYKITVDQVIKLNEDLPKEVIIEDKQAQEQLRLISELDKDDRAIIFKMIDKMLTSKKFKDFFQKKMWLRFKTQKTTK